MGGLTFPFSTAELKTRSWTSLVGGSPTQQRSPRVSTRVHIRVRARAFKIGISVLIGFFAGAALFVALTGALRLYTGTSDAPQPLGLRVERSRLGVVVAWNPASPEIISAKDADLVIWDGSSPAAFVRLTPSQLRAGRTFFTSISDRVEVRLDLIGAAGRARTESKILGSSAPSR